MSEFGIGEQVENVVDDHKSVCAVFLAIDGSFQHAVDTHGYAALIEKKLAFTHTTRGAA